MNTGLKFALGVCSLSLLFSCAQKLPYQDTSLTAEQRAEDLLPRLTLEEKVALMQNASPAIPRLGIKEYDWWNEALHGVGRAGLATVFPQSIGMGASFNDSLLYEVFNAVSDEARVKSRIFSENGVLKRYQGLTFWTPNVNIFRDVLSFASMKLIFLCSSKAFATSCVLYNGYWVVILHWPELEFHS